MMRVLLFVFILFCFNACKRDFPKVVVGNQIWMSTNLDVGRFRNGDIIPQAITNEEWVTAAINHLPAWCYYKNDSVKNGSYGKLYNWYAVNDPRCLAPEGWHVPSAEDWIELQNQVKFYKVSIQPLITSLQRLTTHQNLEIYNSANGLRGHDGNFFEDNNNGWLFWSSSESNIKGSAIYGLLTKDNHAYIGYFSYQGQGHPVRCVRARKLFD